MELRVFKKYWAGHYVEPVKSSLLFHINSWKPISTSPSIP